MKNFKDIMLDIIGWAMIILSVWKLFTIEDLTIQKAIPYLVISLVGVAYVAWKMKGIATKGWSIIKKKFEK